MTKDEALKLALEALELHGKQYPHMVKGYCLDAITAIKEALAQPEQEPVAWVDPKHLEWLAQSPDNMTGAGLAARQRSPDMVSLYTSPPAQRTWVGIAPEEYPDIRYQRETYYAGIKWAEDRLREKNT